MTALLSWRADWHKAAQALYSFGYVILLSTMLLAVLHLCCRFCCRRPFSLASVIGALVIAGCRLCLFILFINPHPESGSTSQEKHNFFKKG